MGKIKRRQQSQPQSILPRLIPPVENWDEDLPDLAEKQYRPPQLICVNEVNDIWMEIPRHRYVIWGGIWSIVFLPFLSSLWVFYFSSLIFQRTSNFLIFIALIFCAFCMLSLFIHALKMVLFEPRGAPVRFNRKRQKVYVYEYQTSIWPWKRWHPVIKVFDWADIHAERVFMAGHADWGHRIYCAACKPGTYEVVDRFVLTWAVGSIYDAYGLWSHCCHYMQAKPVPMAPLKMKKPLTWTPFNTIHWPEDIEQESTTSP
ncbi:hypothetical protein QQF54_00245 [Lelliottia sp. V106_10]|uniref:DUF6708 domain-containing protein n=1 Tax=Lelliottia wanjuensis TaxID=3050585 RepID=UPI002550A0AB|nr:MULTISPECIES: DUF6708 domain-containing protein [unclassified Lelliottia]MDK9355130.1 hypothetical protein [Lelliottia sp. V106_16]MDK9371798.1 hypothetical protein [Lelliottia sp. V106_10]MDK9598975.1 hypothetical protein [Lelliottia sp. V106_5]